MSYYGGQARYLICVDNEDINDAYWITEAESENYTATDLINGHLMNAFKYWYVSKRYGNPPRRDNFSYDYGNEVHHDFQIPLSYEYLHNHQSGLAGSILRDYVMRFMDLGGFNFTLGFTNMRYNGMLFDKRAVMVIFFRKVLNKWRRHNLLNDFKVSRYLVGKNTPRETDIPWVNDLLQNTRYDHIFLNTNTAVDFHYNNYLDNKLIVLICKTIDGVYDHTGFIMAGIREVDDGSEVS